MINEKKLVIYSVEEVITKDDIQEFLRFPDLIYADDKNWICPLDKDIEFVFDSKLNNYHEHGVSIRWVAKDSNRNVVGRIASFINYNTSDTFEYPTGGIGFFECIQNQMVADALFDKSIEWLKSLGIKAALGPINFGENNAWWGLVVKGFKPPIYRNNYNPKYYQSLFENYGFKTYFNQYYYTFNLESGLSERYYQFGKKLALNTDYECKKLNISKLSDYVDDFRTIYNEGWQTHNNFKEISVSRALSLFRQMKPVLDEELIWFVYFKKKPVGFIIMLPELNQLIKHFRKGKFGWLEMIKIKMGLVLGFCNVAHGSVIGFIPSHQNKGLETLLFYHIYTRLMKTKKYKKIEIGWAGDFNPKIVNLYNNLGFNQTHTARTYLKVFDR